MTTTLQTIASTTSKLRALLQETRKDLERIHALQATLTETLNGFFEASLESVTSEDEPECPAQILSADARLWKESLSLVATGSILGVAAQADDVLAVGSSHVRERNWTADGKQYAKWLAKGVVDVAGHVGRMTAAQQLLGKGLGIGYSDELVDSLTNQLVLETPQEQLYCELIKGLTAWEQRRFLSSLMKYLEKLNERFAKRASTIRQDSDHSSGTRQDQDTFIAGVSALMQDLLQNNTTLQDELVEHLMSRQVTTLLVRASLAAVQSSQTKILLERSWQQFGDKLAIKHNPIVQQEANARLLLLTAGLVNRSDPMEVFVLARSSNHGSAVSSRLASSSIRVSWLGMVVGMAVSELVDKEGNKMDFDVEDTKTEEALWYRGLVRIDDRVGNVGDLRALVEANLMGSKATDTRRKSKDAPNAASTNGKKANPVIERGNKLGPRIIEILSSDDEDEDDDLKPYTKPDSDASDEEEDATLVQRNKPKAPVYIRDLISGLEDSENHDRHLISLKSAPGLIRRKADFGAELKDRAEELASTIVGLHDTFEVDDFHDMRQAAMTALVVAQPRVIGPWCAKLFFTGDYSIAQRALILVSVGLGCRELAGYGNENTALIARRQGQEMRENLFPSKQLPAHLHRLYAAERGGAAEKQINAVTHQLEQTMLRPVVTKERTRTKILRNDLASVVADAFFFPFSGNWQAFTSSQYRTGSTTSSRSPLTNPTLLSLFVKTLTIMLSTAGNATTSLPQMTSELWSLLLSQRSRALGHPPLLEATLFGFLTILDVNERRHVADRDATVLLETREWVGLVWERLEEEGGIVGLGNDAGHGKRLGTDDTGSKEVERCKYLAAGVLLRIKEIVDEYQRLMVGDLARV